MENVGLFEVQNNVEYGTTSDMSPNAMVSASDSSKFKAASATDSTTSLTTVTTTASTDTSNNFYKIEK